MSSGELLAIYPLELEFPFELKKRLSCLLQLSNKTDDYVAFKVMTTNPRHYGVRPATGVISPRSKYDVIVTTHAQRAMPPAMQGRDRFLVQSVVTSDGTSSMEMFSKESGNVIEELILRVVYVAKPPSPSAVLDELEEPPPPPPPPPPADPANGNSVTATGQQESVESLETMDSPPHVTALILKLKEDKKVATMKNKLLQQQLEDLAIKNKNKQRDKFSLFFVVVALLIGVYIGYQYA